MIGGAGLPSNVRRFAQLMCFSVVLGFTGAVMLNWHLPGDAFREAALFAGAISAVLLLFTWLIAGWHANWARWALLTVYLLGLIGYVYDPAILADANWRVMPLAIAQAGIQAIALLLIFTGNGAAWFRTRKN